MKKKIDNEPVHHKMFLKTKILSYSNEATDFHYEEIPKPGSVVLPRNFGKMTFYRS